MFSVTAITKPFSVANVSCIGSSFITFCDRFLWQIGWVGMKLVMDLWDKSAKFQLLGRVLRYLCGSISSYSHHLKNDKFLKLFLFHDNLIIVWWGWTSSQRPSRSDLRWGTDGSRSELCTSHDCECTVQNNSLIFWEWKENTNNFYTVLY